MIESFHASTASNCYLLRASLRSPSLSQYFVICDILGDKRSGNVLCVIVTSNRVDKSKKTEKS